MSDNKLKKVKDEATILSLLSGVKDDSAEVFVWRLIGGSKHLANVKIESIRKARCDFCLVPAEGQDRQVQELIGTQSYIDLYVPESALLLRCQIKQTDAPYRYYLQFPEFIAHVDRRKNFRVNVYEQNEVQLSFLKTASSSKNMSLQFQKSCFDLGCGGMSFFVSRMEVKFFSEGDIIPKVDLKAIGLNAKLDAQIVTIRAIEPDEFNGLTYKVWRICCRFPHIDQITKKYLDKFIFERIKEELRVINE